MGDGVWVQSWPENTDKPPPDLNYGGMSPTMPWDGSGKFMGRYCINRHYGAINLAFTDGSARRVPLSALWTLYWHKGARPNPKVIVRVPEK